MGITLDEYLQEIDRWKQPVSEQIQRIDPAQRAERDREAQNWLENQLGRPLQMMNWNELEAPVLKGLQSRAFGCPRE
jgi:hypothetical protein